jgi:hypothetical protein
MPSQMGRVLDDDDLPAVDMITKGAQVLLAPGSPLDDFNSAINTWKERRKDK